MGTEMDRRGALACSVLLVSYAAGAQGSQAPCWSDAVLVTAPDAAPGDQLGWAVALDGDTLVAGANEDDDAGSAYVFERNAGGAGAWGFTVELKASNGAAGDEFGAAVTVSGDTIAVGAPRGDGSFVDGGTVHVYERDLGGPGGWGLAAVLSDPAGQPGGRFGIALGLEGDTLLIGAPPDFASGPGKAFVHGRNRGGTGAWGLEAGPLSSGAIGNDWFGYSVSLRGDTAAIGAPLMLTAFLYERDQGGPGAWGHAATVVDPKPGLGDWFAEHVSLSPDEATLTVGAGLENMVGYQAGGAYVFGRDQGGPGAWGLESLLVPSQIPLYTGVSRYGVPMTTDGDLTVVAGSFSSQAYVFGRDLGAPGAWGELPPLVPPPTTPFSPRFGHSLALVAGTLAIGAPWESVMGGTAGAVYVYELQPAPVASYCTAGVSISGCEAFVTACGTPSVTAPSGFRLWAGNVEGEVSGLFFYGANGRQATPWSGSGFQCVVPPLRRTQLLPTLGDTNECNGALALDLNAVWCPTCPKAGSNPGPGATVQAQLWYLDPPGARFSNAIEFTLTP